MTRQTSVTQRGDAQRVADDPPVERIGEEGDVGREREAVGPGEAAAPAARAAAWRRRAADRAPPAAPAGRPDRARPAARRSCTGARIEQRVGDAPSRAASRVPGAGTPAGRSDVSTMQLVARRAPRNGAGPCEPWNTASRSCARIGVVAAVSPTVMRSGRTPTSTVAARRRSCPGARTRPTACRRRPCRPRLSDHRAGEARRQADELERERRRGPAIDRLPAWRAARSRRGSSPRCGRTWSAPRPGRASRRPPWCRARAAGAQLDLHGLAQLAVERRERLVEQQQLGPHRERARHRDALLLAARQRAHRAVGEGGQMHELEKARDRRARSRPRRAAAPSSPKATFSATVRCGNSA